MEFYKTMPPTMIERLMEFMDQDVTRRLEVEKNNGELYENKLIKELREIIFFYLSTYPLEGKYCSLVQRHISFDEMNSLNMLPYNYNKLSLKRF